MRFYPPCVQHPLPPCGKLIACLAPILTSLLCATAPAQDTGVQGAPISLTGPSTTRLGLTAQYKAVVTGNSRQILLWQVNGVTGGSVGTGTITNTGLYTAPTALPAPNPVTISAVSASNPSNAASVPDQILNPLPTITSAFGTPTATPGVYLLDLRGAGYVSGAQLQVSAGTRGTTTVVSPAEATALLTLPRAPHRSPRTSSTPTPAVSPPVAQTSSCPKSPSLPHPASLIRPPSAPPSRISSTSRPSGSRDTLPSSSPRHLPC